MKKHKITKSIINVRREIIYLTDDIKSFIFSNIHYRRKVWNEFVEESKKYPSIIDFKPLKFHTEYSGENGNMSYRKTHVNYCEGVSKTVSLQINEAKHKCIKRSIKEHKHFELRYKSFDRYYGTFTVDARPTMIKLADTSTRCITRVNICGTNEILFRAHRNRYIPLFLKEPLFYDMESDYYILDESDHSKLWDTSKNNRRCMFKQKDIRQITFIHELGKFYIQLSIKATFINSKREIKHRMDIAGIDLGIHNPIMITDSKSSYSISMSNRELTRIYYLERRMHKLKRIMDRKFKINKSRCINPYSKNYEKVRKKFRITWRKIVMIKDNWRKKVSKLIATRYKNLVIDLCKTPTSSKVESDLNSVARRNINKRSRLYGMSYLNDYIIYACIKYGSNYIKSPKYSTRTCSRCNHINDKLSLSTRVFKCKKCGYTIDRDINASQNCYNHGLDVL